MADTGPAQAPSHGPAHPPGRLWQLLDLLHHGGPGVCDRHQDGEDALFGKQLAARVGTLPAGQGFALRAGGAAGQALVRRGKRNCRPGAGSRVCVRSHLQSEQQLVDCAQNFNNHGCQGYVRAQRAC